jgi:hypothetical protein
MRTEDYWHYNGKYRGVFRLKHSGTTHAAQFYNIQWVALEIREVERVANRDYTKEKVGDFHYEPIIKPKSRWGIGGVELVIIKDDVTAFSESIFNVVLLKHSKERNGFSPLHQFDSIRTTEQEYLVEGIVYFSLPPDPPVVKLPVIANTTPTQIHVVAAPDDSAIIIPDLVSLQPNLSQTTRSLSQQSGCLSLLTNFGGGNSYGGCFGTIFKLIRAIIIFFLLIKLFAFISGFLFNKSGQRMQTDDGEAKTGKLRLDPQQDTLAPQPWNYLMDHEVSWSDFIDNRYDSRYSTSTILYAASQKRHNKWSSMSYTDELLFYHDLYEDLYLGDQKKLDSLITYFDDERKRNKLDPLSTAEMVVTFVQEIPYVLVHDGSCRDAIKQGGFISDSHAQGNPCLPNIVAGVQSPYEFAHNLKGDCDTRSLLAYTLLDRLGIGASVWISRQYGHSILGVAVPASSKNFKQLSGTRYYAVELTTKGFRIGMIAPEHTNMKNWNIVLNNK